MPCTYLQCDFVSVTENILLHSIQLFLDELGYKKNDIKQHLESLMSAIRLEKMGISMLHVRSSMQHYQRQDFHYKVCWVIKP